MTATAELLLASVGQCWFFFHLLVSSIEHTFHLHVVCPFLVEGQHFGSVIFTSCWLIHSFSDHTLGAGHWGPGQVQRQRQGVHIMHGERGELWSGKELSDLGLKTSQGRKEVKTELQREQWESIPPLEAGCLLPMQAVTPVF